MKGFYTNKLVPMMTCLDQNLFNGGYNIMRLTVN